MTIVSRNPIAAMMIMTPTSMRSPAGELKDESFILPLNVALRPPRRLGEPVAEI
jgi:hypothetical protein